MAAEPTLKFEYERTTPQGTYQHLVVRRGNDLYLRVQRPEDETIEAGRVSGVSWYRVGEEVSDEAPAVEETWHRLSAESVLEAPILASKHASKVKRGTCESQTEDGTLWTLCVDKKGNPSRLVREVDAGRIEISMTGYRSTPLGPMPTTIVTARGDEEIDRIKVRGFENGAALKDVWFVPPS